MKKGHNLLIIILKVNGLNSLIKRKNKKFHFVFVFIFYLFFFFLTKTVFKKLSLTEDSNTAMGEDLTVSHSTMDSKGLTT